VALGSTQPPTEMSTTNLPRGKGWPARKAVNVTAICEPIVQRKCGSLGVSQPDELSHPITGFFFFGLYVSNSGSKNNPSKMDANCPKCRLTFN
jgi:hypothetical protein